MRELHVTEHTVEAVANVELVGLTGLAGYDASYLWLALRLGAKLVTLDRQLARAFAASGARSF